MYQQKKKKNKKQRTKIINTDLWEYNFVFARITSFIYLCFVTSFVAFNVWTAATVSVMVFDADCDMMTIYIYFLVSSVLSFFFLFLSYFADNFTVFFKAFCFCLFPPPPLNCFVLFRFPLPLFYVVIYLSQICFGCLEQF